MEKKKKKSLMALYPRSYHTMVKIYVVKINNMVQIISKRTRIYLRSINNLKKSLGWTKNWWMGIGTVVVSVVCICSHV
jgi:hypothetical protein